MANYTSTLTTEERRRLLEQAAASHPIEMFPWFRRWPQSHLRDIVYTFVWNAGFAAIFMLFGAVASGRAPTLGWAWVHLVVANCVGYTLHLFLFLGSCTVERAIRDAGRVAGRGHLLEGQRQRAGAASFGLHRRAEAGRIRGARHLLARKNRGIY